MPKRLCWVRLRFMWEEAQQHILLNRAAPTDDGGYHAVKPTAKSVVSPGRFLVEQELALFVEGDGAAEDVT